MTFRFEAVPSDLPLVGVVDEGLGNTSWAVALDGEVVVVDPERDPEPYVDAADRLGGRIVLTADTHLHADFVTGSPELGARGADVAAPAGAEAAWAGRPLAHGEAIDLGRHRLTATATPGHTPEHVAYVLTEGTTPLAVFTGGSLLVGAVARTDLIDPAETEALTRALWRSIDHELLALPDDVLVLPTHGAGSFCSAAGGGRRWTTIGDERGSNPLLQLDEDDFVRAVLDALGTYPPYFLRLREVNRLGPRVLGSLPLLDRLGADRVRELRAGGAAVIDVRDVAAYADAHVPGSLANALRPQFASWLGWLVPDPATPLVFVTDDHVDRRELVRQCLNIGYEHLAGEIGLDAWREGGGDVASMPLVGVDGLDARHVLDVRQASEYAAGHVPGAAHVELGALPSATASVDGGPLVVMCGHGERAATAASILEAAGHTDVAVLDGGPAGWADAHGAELAR